MTNPECWLYYKLQLILQESKMIGMLANDDWWYTKVQQLLLVESNFPALQITCGDKVNQLIQNFNELQVTRLPVNYSEWWDTQLQQLIDILVFPGMIPEYWWYNKMQLLLLESKTLGVVVSNDKRWWCIKVQLLLGESTRPGNRRNFQDKVNQLLEQFMGFPAGTPLSCSDWWEIKFNELKDNVDLLGMQFDHDYWWYIKMHLLLLESNMSGMLVNCFWWCKKVQELLVESDIPALQITCRDKVNRLLQDFNRLQVAGLLVNYSDWWNTQLQQLIDIIVFPEIMVDIGDSWLILFEEFKTKFKQLSRFVYEERHRKTVYPPADQVFSWTKFCGRNGIYDVKVVILGQDPYHGENQAHGLAFSAQYGTIPPSLQNIYAEIKHGYPEFQNPGHGSLIRWAENGVLLLNTCLTVRKGKPHSHQGRGWEIFTKDVISWFITNSCNVVFMLWGNPARSIEDYIDEHRVLFQHKSKHKFLQASHPAPQSYYSTDKPFYQCNHFYLCNKYLQEHRKSEIDWNTL